MFIQPPSISPNTPLFADPKPDSSIPAGLFSRQSLQRRRMVLKHWWRERRSWTNRQPPAKTPQKMTGGGDSSRHEEGKFNKHIRSLKEKFWQDVDVFMKHGPLVLVVQKLWWFFCTSSTYLRINLNVRPTGGRGLMVHHQCYNSCLYQPVSKETTRSHDLVVSFVSFPF